MEKDDLDKKYDIFKKGHRYRVIRTFTDYRGRKYTSGDVLEFTGSNFVPYDSGLSLFFKKGNKEIQMMLCKQEGFQNEIASDLKSYFEAVLLPERIKDGLQIDEDTIELSRLLFKLDPEIGNRFLESLFHEKMLLPPELFCLSLGPCNPPLLGYGNALIVADNDFDTLIKAIEGFSSYGSHRVGMSLLAGIAQYQSKTLRLRAIHHLKMLSNVLKEPNFRAQTSRLTDFALKAWPYDFVQIFEEEYTELLFKPFQEFYSSETDVILKMNRMREHPFKWLTNEDYLRWNFAFCNLAIKEFAQTGIDMDRKDMIQLLAFINGNTPEQAAIYLSNYLKYVPVDPAVHFKAKTLEDKGKPAFLTNQAEFDYVSGRILNFMFYFHKLGKQIELEQIESVLSGIKEAWNRSL